ncbi:hypothetical protein K1719_038806 [Acacia pycnantha]|nr:hypothetical protein K1719_038806 [Acacia pycnantha]
MINRDSAIQGDWRSPPTQNTVLSFQRFVALSSSRLGFAQGSFMPQPEQLVSYYFQARGCIVKEVVIRCIEHFQSAFGGFKVSEEVPSSQ